MLFSNITLDKAQLPTIMAIVPLTVSVETTYFLIPQYVLDIL